MFTTSNFQRLFVFLLLVGGIFMMTSCEDPVMMDEPCDGIEFTGNNLTFNGESFQISEYTYSDAIVLNHNFRFKAFADDCMDSLDLSLDFGNFLSFPTFSLAGDYITVFATNPLEVDENEVGGFFRNGGSSQYLVSGGTANISEPDENSYLITVDATTSSLTGGSTDVMQLNVTVAK